jgi:hypothetical protein
MPDSGDLLIRHHHMFNKADTASAHTMSGRATYQGGVVTISVGIVFILLCIITYVTELLIMSWEKRKLDRLKKNPWGATNEAPACAVPMHAPQMSSFWRGVGEVSSAGEVGV